MTDHALLFRRFARERHKHVASSIKLRLLTSPNSRATFRKEYYCGIAAPLKRFEDFREKSLYTSVCTHAQKFNDDVNIAARHICILHNSFYTTFFFYFF